MKHDQIRPELTVSATEFKARCLDLLDQVNSGRIARLTVTKRGKPVAVVNPLQPEPGTLGEVYGVMRDSVFIPEGVDIVGPIFEDEILAEQGVLHT